ncbi:substrate-binding domain-containing protein [Archangium sp. miwbw1]|uniref:Substrate-binding domain-containing protein n=1 Tax=Archangium lansingense TaxID=2995310 RepID=A0ABT3ZXD5_9BACT|nr:substrate-binding domain-containing protein [Archangium lansinium]MCY1074055.1 substrate-binding domain-containing protein [Archangium lansinium]
MRYLPVEVGSVLGETVEYDVCSTRGQAQRCLGRERVLATRLVTGQPIPPLSRSYAECAPGPVPIRYTPAPFCSSPPSSLVGLSPGCGPARGSSGSYCFLGGWGSGCQKPADTSPSLVYAGSGSIGNAVLRPFSEGFERRGGRPIEAKHYVGSAEGFKLVMEGRADLGGLARSLTSTEKAQQPYYVIIGYAALAVYVHPDNPVPNLSRNQLKAFFTGEVKNWKDVGGPDAPVELVTVERSFSRCEDALTDRGIYLLHRSHPGDVRGRALDALLREQESRPGVDRPAAAEREEERPVLSQGARRDGTAPRGHRPPLSL